MRTDESAGGNPGTRDGQDALIHFPWSVIDTESRRKVAALDERIILLLDEYSVPLLRYSLAIVFFWFGVLKPIGVSSATEIVSKTVYFLPPELFVPVLGIWEMLIGVCLLHKRLLRAGIALLLLQMAGTFLPLVLLPDVSFATFPLVPSLEGQYILKNLVLISGALVVASYSLDPIPDPE
jgi:uncharacterized membrane protein YkgB